MKAFQSFEGTDCWHHEDDGITFFRNARNHSPKNRASHLWAPDSTATLLTEPEISTFSFLCLYTALVSFSLFSSTCSATRCGVHTVMTASSARKITLHFHCCHCYHHCCRGYYLLLLFVQLYSVTDSLFFLTVSTSYIALFSYCWQFLTTRLHSYHRIFHFITKYNSYTRSQCCMSTFVCCFVPPYFNSEINRPVSTKFLTDFLP